jgi:hypothetical protein
MRQDFNKLLKEVETTNRLRRYVAHSVWKRGRKAGCIKPMHISARRTVKMTGMKHHEKEYSASDLQVEADRMAQIGQQLKSFLDHHGLRVPLERTVR